MRNSHGCRNKSWGARALPALNVEVFRVVAPLLFEVLAALQHRIEDLQAVAAAAGRRLMGVQNSSSGKHDRL